jgi:hypothetical protein
MIADLSPLSACCAEELAVPRKSLVGIWLGVKQTNSTTSSGGNRHERHGSRALDRQCMPWAAKEPDQNAGRCGRRGNSNQPSQSLRTRSAAGRTTRGRRQALHQARLAFHGQRSSPRRRCHARTVAMAFSQPQTLEEPSAAGHVRLDRSAFVPHADGGGGDSRPRSAAAVGQLRGMGAVQEPEQPRRRFAPSAEVATARVDYGDCCGGSWFRPNSK